MVGPKKEHLPRNYRPVGEFLKEARTRAGLTQREVSVKLGYASAQNISNFENGLMLPPLKNLVEMALLYRVDKHKLLDLILESEREVMLSAFNVRQKKGKKA